MVPYTRTFAHLVRIPADHLISRAQPSLELRPIFQVLFEGKKIVNVMPEVDTSLQ